MLDVTRGWPNKHASTGVFRPMPGQDIVEGDFVIVVDDGSGSPVIRLATSSDTVEQLDYNGGQVLDTNTSAGFDVRYSGVMPVVRSNYTAKTDRFTSSAGLIPGALLQIDASRPGRLALRTGSNPIVASVEALDAVNGILTIRRR